MERLIQISTTDAKISHTVRKGHISFNTENPSYTMERQKGGLSIDSTLPKLHIDQKAAFDSVNPSVGASISKHAQEGMAAVKAKAEEFSQHAAMFREAKVGDDVIAKIVAQDLSVNTNVGLEFTPKTGPTFSFEPGELNMKFEVDTLKFDWRVQQLDVEFVPTEIDFNLIQEASVNIEYLGGPVYVPRDYVPGST